MTQTPKPSIEDLIVSNQQAASRKPSIVEALLSTVTVYLRQTANPKIRLTAQHVRGWFGYRHTNLLRATLEKDFVPFIDPDTGEMTTETYDNRVLTRGLTRSYRPHHLNGASGTRLSASFKRLAAPRTKSKQKQIRYGGLIIDPHNLLFWGGDIRHLMLISGSNECPETHTPIC